MKKKLISSFIAIFAVLALLFIGMGTIANASNARNIPVESRSAHRIVWLSQGVTTVQASSAVGYFYHYNQLGWRGDLPRTFFTFGAGIATGQFNGNVQCVAPCQLRP